MRSVVLHVCVLLAVACAPFAHAALPLPADSSGMDWSRVPEYRIVPGDVLDLNFGLKIDGVSENRRQVRVRPDGRITVYPVGDVVAAGRSPMELQRAIIDLLAADLRAPRVTVDVMEIAGNQVHVLGRVTRPGSYPATPFMTTMQAIAAAGGFSDDAARNSVVIFHRDGARTLRVTRVRADRVLKGHDLADQMLSRFDIVYVPRSAIGNFDVFARQFFGEPTQILQFGLIGWELFNIDRVFVTRVARVDQ